MVYKKTGVGMGNHDNHQHTFESPYPKNVIASICESQTEALNKKRTFYHALPCAECAHPYFWAHDAACMRCKPTNGDRIGL